MRRRAGRGGGRSGGRGDREEDIGALYIILRIEVCFCVPIDLPLFDLAMLYGRPSNTNASPLGEQSASANSTRLQAQVVDRSEAVGNNFVVAGSGEERSALEAMQWADTDTVTIRIVQYSGSSTIERP